MDWKEGDHLESYTTTEKTTAKTNITIVQNRINGVEKVTGLCHIPLV